ncbi:MAG: hypothetical protein L6R19_21340, partial [Alphaproteobacteria bacterium]|nr:hypothetical protein [Alphaproteobacteria bacterium]
MTSLIPRWPARLRLLPLTIFGASLLLTVKLGALFTPGVPAKDAISVTPTHAQQTQPAQAPGKAAPTPLTPPAKPAAAAAQPTEQAQASDKQATPPAPGAAPAAPVPAAPAQPPAAQP